MRAACDKCHFQKLRCIRQRGEDRCVRCLRLDAQCFFSPRAPRGSIKAPSLVARRTLISKGNECDLVSAANISLRTASGPRNDFDFELPTESDGLWDSVRSTTNAIDSITTQPPRLQMNDLVSFESLQTLELSEHSSRDLGLATLPDPELLFQTTVTTANELACLSIALSTIAEKLPSLSENEGTCSSQYGDTAFVFDELFHLTTHFNELLEQRLLSSTTANPDEPTVLMIAACHSSLSNIYSVVFFLIQRCIRHSLPPPRPRPDWAVILPNVQMGVLSWPPMRVGADAAVSISKQKAFMYISMISVFSGELLGRLTSAMKEQQRRAVVHDSQSTVGILWADMVRRADMLVRNVESIQGSLI